MAIVPPALDQDYPGFAPDPQIAQLRIPPHSMEAESSVIGGLLLDNGATDALAQGVDVLVRAKLRDRDDPADLVVRSVGSFGLGLYARADLARRVGDPDTAAHWEDLPWIGHLGYGRAADLRLRQGERECVLKMRPWIWANDVMALIRLVEHGAGFAVLPLRLAQPAVAAGRMQAVLADWAFPRVPLCLAWRNRRRNA